MRALVLAGLVVAVACDRSDVGSTGDRPARSEATPVPEHEPEPDATTAHEREAAPAVEREPVERAGVGGLVGSLFGDTPSIAEIHEADAIPERLRGEAVRVHGWVQPGSPRTARACRPTSSSRSAPMTTRPCRCGRRATGPPDDGAPFGARSS